MEGIRLQVQIMPWQDTEGSESNGVSTREEIAPFALRPVPPELLIEDLAEQIVERFEKIHTGKGKLHIKYLRDGYKGIIEMGDFVGHHFVDRTKGNTRKEDFTVHVYRYPPDQKELTDPHRFSSVAPDSSASWRRSKRPISGQPEPALIRYSNGRFYHDTGHGNKRQRLDYGDHKAVNGLKGSSIASTENNLTPTARDGYNLVCQSNLPEVMILDSQVSSQRKPPHMYGISKSPLNPQVPDESRSVHQELVPNSSYSREEVTGDALAIDHPRNETPKSESPEIDVRSVPASNPSTPPVQGLIQQDEDIEEFGQAKWLVPEGKGQNQIVLSDPPVFKELSTPESVPRIDKAPESSTGKPSSHISGDQESLKPSSGSKAFNSQKTSGQVPNPADFDIETSQNVSGIRNNHGVKQQLSLGSGRSFQDVDFAPSNTLKPLPISKFIAMGRDSNAVQELLDDSSSSDSVDSIPFEIGIMAKKSESSTKERKAQQNRSPSDTRIEDSKTISTERYRNSPSKPTSGGVEDRRVNTIETSNEAGHAGQDQSSFTIKSNDDAAVPGMTKDGPSRRPEKLRRTVRARKQRVTSEAELSKRRETGPSPASKPSRSTSRLTGRKQAVAEGEQSQEKALINKTVGTSVSVEALSFTGDEAEKNIEESLDSSTEVTSSRRKGKRRKRPPNISKGASIGEPAIGAEEEDGISKRAQGREAEDEDDKHAIFVKEVAGNASKEVADQSIPGTRVRKERQFSGTFKPRPPKAQIKLTPVFPGPRKSSPKARSTRQSRGGTTSHSKDADQRSNTTPTLPPSPTMGRSSVSIVDGVIGVPRKERSEMLLASDISRRRAKSKKLDNNSAKSRTLNASDWAKYREQINMLKQGTNARSPSQDHDSDTIRVSLSLPPLPSFKDILTVPSREMSLEGSPKLGKKLDMSMHKNAKTTRKGSVAESRSKSPVGQEPLSGKSVNATQSSKDSPIRSGEPSATSVMVPSKSLSRSPAREIPSSSPSSSGSGSETESESGSEIVPSVGTVKTSKNANVSANGNAVTDRVTASRKRLDTPYLGSESHSDSDVSIPLPKMQSSRSRSGSAADEAERQLQREARHSIEPARSPQTRLPPKTPSKPQGNKSSTTAKGGSRPPDARFPSLSGMMKAAAPAALPAAIKDPWESLQGQSNGKSNPKSATVETASKKRNKVLLPDNSTDSEEDESEEDESEDEEMVGSQSKAARSVKGLLKLAGKAKR